jgi:FkbM family methyltransferase
MSGNSIELQAYKTRVLDAGGRYGLHPSWKPFTGELEYYLFEADPVEAKRLAVKYSHRSDEVKVVDRAVAEKNGNLTINFFKNRAMSGAATRNPVSSLFKDERASEVEITETIEVEAVSIDSFCKTNDLSLDFLKLDTEGSEFQILQGAKKQLKENILGVRCEVAFDYIFEGMPLFSTIHDFMLSQDYYLLNLDYEGHGDYQNNAVNIKERYGILTFCDAIWMKRPKYLFEPLDQSKANIGINVMKYAAFLLNNNAPDVAIDILLRARQDEGLFFELFQESLLYKFLDIYVHKLFYNLKWQPGQSLIENQSIFQKIFGKKMKTMNDFMECDELNPD